MTPVVHGWEARYLRASRAAHRAWLATQPQFVLPGVLEEVDATRADGDNGCGVHLLEPAAALVAASPGGLDNPERRTSS